MADAAQPELGKSATIRIPVGENASNTSSADGDRKMPRIGAKQRRPVESRLAQLDTDGDGIIDRQELVLPSLRSRTFLGRPEHEWNVCHAGRHPAGAHCQQHQSSHLFAVL